MSALTPIIHGTAIGLAIDADGPLFGTLLIGPPGSGKSTLALSLIAGCRYGRSRLIADDAVRIDADASGVYAAAPAATAGLAEIRGIGPVRLKPDAGQPAGAPIPLRVALELGVTGTERLGQPRVWRGPGGATLPLLIAPPAGVVVITLRALLAQATGIARGIIRAPLSMTQVAS